MAAPLQELSEGRTANKRRRLNSPPRAQRVEHQKPITRPKTNPHQLSSLESGLDDDEIWADQAFFSVGLPPAELDVSENFDFLDVFFGPDQNEERENWQRDIASLSRTLSNDIEPEVLTEVLYPGVPDEAHRHINLNLLNPFSEGAVGRYDKPRTIVATTKEGEVNGYIKFRLEHTHTGFDEPTTASSRSAFGQHHRQFPTAIWKLPEAVVPLLPPNFGRGLKLDTNDQKLLTFYLTAYCQGRTLIPKHNFWLTEITPMAESEPIVRESLLALSGAYVLDYVQSEQLRKRTSHHYENASQLISQALSSPESHAVNKSDDLIAAVILMEADDEVFWELRRPKTEIPNFHKGNMLAKSILDHSDPGYRYWKPNNVQHTKSWAGMSACVAAGCILAEMMSPLLAKSPNDRNYSWLLGGTKKEAHTIYGAKGLSPKLIHTLAQITRLCSEMKETPESIIIPMAASKINEMLNNLRQRSEFSEGHATADALLMACELDEQGKVFTPVRATELSAEAWLCAAKIYLHCRFSRKPLSHPNIRANLSILMRCVKRLPQEGPLLTAQSPFFPVFLMAIVSYQAEDRAVAQEWFEGVVSNGGRSNIPPVWQAVQLLWDWSDRNINDLAYDDSSPVGSRRAWWEDMWNGRVTTAVELTNLSQACQENGLILAIDETITALRCGAPFAHQRPEYKEAGKPDLVFFGKALGINGIGINFDGPYMSRLGIETSSKKIQAIHDWQAVVDQAIHVPILIDATGVLEMATAGDWVSRSRIIGRHFRNIASKRAQSMLKGEVESEINIIGGLDSFIFVHKDVAETFLVTGASNAGPWVRWVRWLPRMDCHLTNLRRVEDLLLRGGLPSRRQVSECLEKEGLRPQWCFNCGNSQNGTAFPWCKNCCIDICDAEECVKKLLAHTCLASEMVD